MIRVMRKNSFALGFSALMLCSSLALLAQADVIAKLGSNTAEAQNTVFEAFSSGDVSMAGSRSVWKSANDQARASMVTAVVGFARTYSTSADFLKRWGTFRENQKPSPPTAGPTSMASMQAQQIKAMEEGIHNLEETAKKMPQLKATFDEQIKAMREQIAELKKTDPAANAEMDKILKQGAEQGQAAYKQSVAKWEKDYPVDPKPFIVKRLRDFLTESATVDFTAKLVKSRDGMMRFENQAYESKDSNWKYMYRAGKPAVDAARAAAQEWLKALGG